MQKLNGHIFINRESLGSVTYNSKLARRPLPKEPDRQLRESTSFGDDINVDDNITVIYEDLEQCSDWRTRQKVNIKGINFQRADYNKPLSFPKLSPPALPSRAQFFKQTKMFITSFRVCNKFQNKLGSLINSDFVYAYCFRTFILVLTQKTKN